MFGQKIFPGLVPTRIQRIWIRTNRRTWTGTGILRSEYTLTKIAPLLEYTKQNFKCGKCLQNGTIYDVFTLRYTYSKWCSDIAIVIEICKLMYIYWLSHTTIKKRVLLSFEKFSTSLTSFRYLFWSSGTILDLTRDVLILVGGYLQGRVTRDDLDFFWHVIV